MEIGIGTALGLVPVAGDAPVIAATLSSFSLSDNELTGTTDQHGTLYIMTSAEASRTAAQIKAGTGAEDAFSFFVNLGNFDFTLNLENTTTDVDRWMHFVLENDNGFSNIPTPIQFEIILPVPWSITVDGSTVTINSAPIFDSTPWSITPKNASAQINTHPQEIT